MMTAVQLNHVTLKFKKFKALEDISLTLEAGKIHGLIGRNGAGKTSLLSLIAAFREPTAGEVSVDGAFVFENPEKMEQIAFIYDKDYKEETEKAKKLIALASHYRPHFDMGYAEHLIKRFKLPVDKPVNKLSKGMQSALNVVIGLASRAPVTIFDEAYLGMDAPAREIFYKEILIDQEEHPRTFILSTHLVSEMDYLFDHVIIIDQGRLVLNEPYETLEALGASVTGAAADVDAFTATMQRLNEQQLGGTKSVMVYGELGETKRQEAHALGLEIGPVSLQDLFIYLTEEAN
ncbi:ATP-binding cassette domain-containing protein [Planococcus maritimus]|uniref:ATP-binding cassette domain-containing protein n=1 Tax=Planococcus maritimus TaxID=192421 RepID=UPI0007966314|nr:ABC transporter ATP-binding protein [Planococcus maritimus]KYG58383.1 ABC transporter [Planococcus maritimus]OED31864.1 ABC transporter [Planococcus maritimus]